MEFIQNFRNNPFFTEIVFLVALLLILGAWKFGLDGLME